MSKLPIVFLAFANEKEQEAAYLRGLSQEQRLLGKVFESAQDQGKCEVIVQYNATIADVFDVFQKEKNQGRICIFHFAGHANSFQLLMESSSGGNESANADALIRFLARQDGLKFVFLNACSTEGQVHQLIEAGIPAIATSQSVNDGVATNFAVRFYKGLVNNRPLGQAFEETADYIESYEVVGGVRDLYWEGAEEAAVNGVPWKLHALAGDESLLEWSLEKQRQANEMAGKADFRQEAQSLIAKGKMEKALQLALENLEGTDLHEEVLAIQARLKRLARQERGGLLSFDEATRENAKITHALLGLLGEA